GTTAFFAGGDDNTRRVDLFDTATGAWSLQRLSHGRAHVVGAAAGRFVAFAGGDYDTRHGAHRVADTVDFYNTRTHRWTVGHLSLARDVAAAATVGSKFLFAGGGDTDVVDIYDASTNTWSVAHLA